MEWIRSPNLLKPSLKEDHGYPTLWLIESSLEEMFSTDEYSILNDMTMQLWTNIV